MKTLITALAVAALAAGSAQAQQVSGSTSTATSSTASQSYSTATGGQSQSTSGASVDGVSATTGASTATNGAANSSNEQNITFNDAPQLPKQKVVTTGQAIAPGLAASLGDGTCLGSVSVGAGWLGANVGAGKTYEVKSCVNRLNARELAQTLGDKDAARALMCQNRDVARAYAAVGNPCPGVRRR